MKTIFMTDPSNFSVDYCINPWMDGNIGAINPEKAKEQWSALKNSLVDRGVNVLTLPQSPEHCPDAVFTANAGLVYKNKFILSRFHFDERSVEEPFFFNWFTDKAFNVVDISSQLPRKNYSFEGAGDALFNIKRNILWMGFGFRSTLNFKVLLDNIFESEDIIVRPLELVNESFYHLDTCFCPTDLGHVLWYPGAFSEYSRYTIETWYPGMLIEVNEKDAANFACNAVSSNADLFVPKISSELEEKLTGLGYNVIQHDMSEFLKSGGACKCLTLEKVL